MVTQLDHLCG